MLRIFIYEDIKELREGLTMLINGSEGLQVVGVRNSCDTVLSDLEEASPDVILMDIDMPGTSGLEGLRLIREMNQEVKILMLTVFDDNEHLFQAITSGASGYLLKKTPPAKLLEYIIEAHSGGAPMTATIATQVLKMFSTIQPTQHQEDFQLTDREKQVLHLLVEGYSYKMIAAEKFIAIDTVRSHVKKIYEKLQVNSKAEAISKSYKHKIV